MSKPLSSLRDFLDRTRARLPVGLGRTLPDTGDPDDRQTTERPSQPARPDWSRPSDGERSEPLLSRLIARQSVTASVEGNSFRALILTNGRIVDWSAMTVGARSARGSQINDPISLGTDLDSAFGQLRWPRSNVAWALPGYQASIRILELPGLRGAELRQAIEEEFERILGASMSDFFLSWQRLEGRVRQRNVFVVAIPQTTVLSAIEALDVANIQARTMDLRPLALARALGCTDAVVTNLEDGCLDIVVVDRSVPSIVRSLPLVGASAAKDAAQSRLVEEIERTLVFYDDSNPDHPLDLEAPIYLTGSLATGIGLAERVRTVTRHPIGRLKPAGTFPPECPVAEYLVALGLALKRS